MRCQTWGDKWEGMGVEPEVTQGHRVPGGPGGLSPLSRTLRSHGGMRAMLPDGQGMTGDPPRRGVAGPAPPRAGEDESSKRPRTGKGCVGQVPVLGEEGAVSDLGSRKGESQALGTDFSWWKLSGPGPVLGVPGGSLQGLGGEGAVRSGGKRPPPHSWGWGQ